MKEKYIRIFDESHFNIFIILKKEYRVALILIEISNVVNEQNKNNIISTIKIQLHFGQN